MTTSETDKRLKAFVDRAERLLQDQAALAEDLKELFGEAKANGYDAAMIKKMVKLQKMDDEKRREAELLENTYRAAVGLCEFAE